MSLLISEALSTQPTAAVNNIKIYYNKWGKI